MRIEDMSQVLIERRLIELEIEHEDLDSVIDELVQSPSYDELRLRRLKKHRLQLRDEIAYLRSLLDPNERA